ncbi:MAG: hypothetical protein K9W45_07550 [Candidatus Heimdallarchaeum aukensis]|uniref:Uncharacterized protein n=1 Tax=Candidatus Heimdallarchaeum aukensis TaxID=2876573 RepID=A0A9Y1FKA1_9ARCH|nr:MAG: hypothetical protein K9W45_07550 [Candidatus Heimdallarchaeum aukensis]
MKKKLNFISIVILLTLVNVFVQHSVAYVPENTIIVNQIVDKYEGPVNSNISMSISVKNYMNFTLTNITISLNLSSNTDLESVKFTSCDFGQLSGDNVTLNETILSSSEGIFTPLNITEGYLTEKYFEVKVDKMENGTKFLVNLNITAEEEGDYTIPRVKVTYLDNWGDKKKTESSRNVQLSFKKIESWSEDVPYWKGGKKLTPTVATVIFALAPVLIAIASSYIFTIKIRRY